MKTFPEYENRDLVQQMRRASKSIPANIAEGFSRRRSAKEFKLYLAHAMGSPNEVLVHLEVAGELGYASEDARKLLGDGHRVVCRQLKQTNPELEMMVFRHPISNFHNHNRRTAL